MTDRRAPHIGPVPQDFRAAFGVGADDDRIHPVDGVGVSLAAIQGLYQLVQEQAREIDDLRARVERAERAASRP